MLSGYGINCEEETAFVFEKQGGEAEVVHINDLIEGHKKFADYQILAVPGGFSYGDDTGAGKALANKVYNNLREDILEFIRRDTLTIGICNGFQVITALGLVPAVDGDYGVRQAALMNNENARYVCRWVKLKVKSSKCVFTRGIDEIFVPVAHGEGNFYAEQGVLDKLVKDDQVVFQYIKEDGSLADGEYPFNPNGAVMDIAGICDPTGRILGMMPHPERHLFTCNRPDYHYLKEVIERAGKQIPEEGEGNQLFENAVKYFLDK